jgi:hypothetical protein
VTSEDDPAVAINFDTPAAATTPTATTSQVNEWLKQQEKNEKKRKQVDTPLRKKVSICLPKKHRRKMNTMTMNFFRKFFSSYT